MNKGNQARQQKELSSNKRNQTNPKIEKTSTGKKNFKETITKNKRILKL
jgi:hypothetical protein